VNYSPFLGKTSNYPVDISVKNAFGCHFYDNSGKKYTDLISGIGVSYVGHGHPSVIEAVKKQIDSHMHVMVYGEFDYNSQKQLAQKLISLLGDRFEQIFFTNSGTEANEGAIKLAKRATKRPKIISFTGAYHGSTQGSLSVSGNENRKRNFRPLLPGIEFLPFGDIASLKAIDQDTAAVIIEPVQGDAGVRIPDLEFMKALREACTNTGAVLIFDEIQTGMGRTGKWFCFQHYNTIPDIITLGKSLGGGLPLGGFATSKKLMETLTHNPPLGHITTFGGNPVCCAAGLASILVVENENLMEQVEEKGKLFERLLNHKEIKGFRRIGLMMAIELEDAQKVETAVKNCLDQGVLIYWFLSTPNAFRIAPPLIISNKEIKESCEVILKVLNTI